MRDRGEQRVAHGLPLRMRLRRLGLALGAGAMQQLPELVAQGLGLHQCVGGRRLALVDRDQRGAEGLVLGAAQRQVERGQLRLMFRARPELPAQPHAMPHAHEVVGARRAQRDRGPVVVRRRGFVAQQQDSRRPPQQVGQRLLQGRAAMQRVFGVAQGVPQPAHLVGVPGAASRA